MQSRNQKYFKLSSQIAQIDNAQLRSLFDNSELSAGWGKNHTIDIGQSKVFVKRLPVTDLEYDNMFSTNNLYDLPTYYNYGVGSAGFGVFRELVANIKTTNWVLEGAIAHFPLLYHYRIIPFSGVRPDVDMERHRGYIAYWNSNENIGRYMLDRANANYELVLFLEHMPYSIEPWLLENPNKINRVLEDLREAVAFLRKNGIVHFDANFENVLSDGEHAYLTDFGLVLDKGFTLTQDEALLLKQNTYYDYGEVLGSLGFLLSLMYESQPDNDKHTVMGKYGIAEGTHPVEMMPILLNNIEEIIVDGSMKLDKEYVAAIVKYRGIIMLFFDFFIAMRRNKRKDTKFPSAKLAQLLKETGFISGDIAKG
jgi:hypothetical protein